MPSGLQAPIPPFRTLNNLYRGAAERERRFDFRLVGGWKGTARLGGALGRGRLGGVLGEREDSLPGGGEFPVLPEPRLEGGDLQGE